MKTKTACALLSAIGILVFFSASAFAQTPVFIRHAGEQSLQIDGQLDEWTQFPGSTPGINLFVLGEESILLGKRTWTDASDLRAEFAFAHNFEDLFIAIRINDQNLTTTDQYLTTDDHVEIWFAQPNNSAAAMGVAIYCEPEKNQISVRTLSPGNLQAIETLADASAAVTGMNSFYTLEARIPISSLPGGEDQIADLKAALYVVDNDSSKDDTGLTILGTASALGRGSAKALPTMQLARINAR